jgi:hypothetical protein
MTILQSQKLTLHGISCKIYYEIKYGNDIDHVHSFIHLIREIGQK